MKTKGLNETQFLALLQKVLSAKTADAHLVSEIYEGVAHEVRILNGLESLEKFCAKEGVPDAEPETIATLQAELEGKFGEETVTVTPAESGVELEVEVTLPDRTVSHKVKVDPTIGLEEESVAPFVPFPVSLPEDPELVWALARRENLGPDEAARALAKIEEEFWQTKKGLQMQKDRVEKSFAEFIANVPASALTESGLRRHYKGPETLRSLRLLAGSAGAAVLETVA
ncbi:MAG TPA: hypothetical protein VGO11_14555 [Chthoniobacteraceae bacterium]|jgi:hypothetical protein|nr:hypothetical protein [Chthoniobacteraceae bacterium]